MSIGIMHGRLSPPEDGRFQSFPRDSWREEFVRADEAGLATIEWIWDSYGEDVNPLGNSIGIREIADRSARHGVAVRSVCADYFMDYPLVRSTGAELAARQGALSRLIERCGEAAIERIVLPFVDASRLETAEDHGQVTRVLHDAIQVAEPLGVQLHLETDLAPRDFARLLEGLPHPLIQVNYDAGNSASLGYRPAEEFAAYGQRVGSVHIKDRRLGGTTVPLGTGDADFEALAAALESVAYDRDYILQVARGPDGEEVSWSRSNVAFVEQRFPGAAS
jgi:hexulose-6-phosphate isomerase